MEPVYAHLTVSLTELERDLSNILAQAGDSPVAVLNHNKPEAYLLSARHYESILNALEDAEDRKLVEERGKGPFVEVSLDEL